MVGTLAVITRNYHLSIGDGTLGTVTSQKGSPTRPTAIEENQREMKRNEKK
jgi:hypothetical protein